MVRVKREGYALIVKRWRGMMSRCYNPADCGFKNYSARGIGVYEGWHDREQFYRYVIDTIGIPDETKERKTLDRIDNDRGYEPNNIRWSSYKTQERNRSINVWVEYNGRNMLLVELSDECGIRATTLYDRIFRQNWTVKEAAETKILKKSERIKERSAKTEIRVTYNGETKLLKHWCREFGLAPCVVRSRLHNGWTVHDAFNTVPDKGKSSRDKAERLMFDGKLMTYNEISKLSGVMVGTLRYRVNKMGISIEDAVKHPHNIKLESLSAGSAKKDHTIAGLSKG